MRQIDLQSWSRREHFNVYSSVDHPHFSLSANVDVTDFFPAIKQGGFSFSLAVVYVITRTANDIPEFRCRIRPGMVVEHEIVHPSTTIMTTGDLFSFCTFDYVDDFYTFVEQAVQRINCVRKHPTIENVPGRDDMIYMTAIPWVSFTSFMHPLHMHPVDSVPRFAWGKIFSEADRLKMPLSVQAHHALMDGVHIGQYYEQVQAYLNQPDDILNQRNRSI